MGSLCSKKDDTNTDSGINLTTQNANSVESPIRNANATKPAETQGTINSDRTIQKSSSPSPVKDTASRQKLSQLIQKSVPDQQDSRKAKVKDRDKDRYKD